ncbi:hypothetical protein V493_07569, partial [Pseudogymnoascus sp. VKM F-4281 (FW-2241)]
ATRTASWYPRAIFASGQAKKRVPIATPAAPSTIAAATPRPSAMPPAATTGILKPSARSASVVSGTSATIEAEAARPCPPASAPWRTRTSGWQSFA